MGLQILFLPGLLGAGQQGLNVAQLRPAGALPVGDQIDLLLHGRPSLQGFHGLLERLIHLSRPVTELGFTDDLTRQIEIVRGLGQQRLRGVGGKKDGHR